MEQGTGGGSSFRYDISRNMVLWILPCLFAAVFIAGSVLQLYAFKVNDWDFSYFSVLGWNIGHGLGWHVPFHEESSVFPFYMHHWPPFAAVLAPFLRFFETPYTLSILHALAIGTPFFLLPRLVKVIYSEAGRNDWGNTALFLQVLMFLYIPFLGAWRYQTHLTTLVAPAILCALLALHAKRYAWAWFWCVILASGQERSAAAVFGIGMYAFLLLRLRALGLGMCLFSSLYFAGALKLMGWLRGGASYAFSSGIAPLVDLGDKGIFFLNFFRYTLFLPCFGRKALFAAACAMPTVAIGLVSNRESMYAFAHHYQDMASLFMLVAAIYGCLYIQQHYKKYVRYLVPTGLLVMFFSLLFSPFIRLHPLYVITECLFWENIQEKKLLHKDIDALLHISKGKVLRVQSGLGPMVSLREQRYTVSSFNINKQFYNEIVAISALAGVYTLNSYGQAKSELDANPSLHLVIDTGRLRVYASKDVSVTWKAKSNL